MPDSPQIQILLEEYAKQTGGHCGLTVAELHHRSGLPLSKVKVQLGGLHKEKLIRVRDGIHGKLIFLNNSNPISK